MRSLYYRHSKIINLGAITWPCYNENSIVVRHVLMRLKCIMNFNSSSHNGSSGVKPFGKQLHCGGI